MNARTALPAPTPSTVTGCDREFLPAALEILETPPPPLPVALTWTICFFALAALVWSCVGRLDVHAVALGKIETVGFAKVIEPLAPGKIAAIHVQAGQPVKAGELLLELDPAEAEAGARSARDALNASLAEIDRRRYVIIAARAAQAEPARGNDASPIEALAAQSGLKVAWDVTLPEPFRLREAAVLRADLAQLSDSLKEIDKKTAEKLATREKLDMSIASQRPMMDTLNQRVSTRQQAFDLHVGTKIDLYNAKEELEKAQAELALTQGQLIETSAAVKELDSEKAKTVSQFVADNQNKLDEASRQADEARQALAKAIDQLAQTRLSAPIDGVVQQTAVTTVGQVVTTGQQLAVITPAGGKLQVEALLANRDVGFVKPGQEAVIKVDAFPFTQFGVLHGKVIKIAPAAVSEEEAKRALADATATANAAQTQAPVQGQPENFVFPATIALDETSIHVNGAAIALTPGMTATVEIKTDSRRVIDYLLAPLAKIASEAARER
jgi:hemolysin D